MSKKIYSLFFLCLLSVFLLFGKEVVIGASVGLQIWYERVLPVLFPLMILSGLTIHLQISGQITSFFHPILYSIFRTNYSCEYVILIGMLCGFPMGAITVSQMIQTDQITPKQGDYLLAFCNNISPIYFTNTILSVFPSLSDKIILIFCMYGIPLLYGLILRYSVYRNDFENPTKKPTIITRNFTPTFAFSFRKSIESAVSSIVYIGGCMICFRILAQLVGCIPFFNNNWVAPIVSGIMELNLTAFHIQNLCTHNHENEALILASFLHPGGLSCILQTAGILEQTSCSIRRYFIHKCIQGLLWIILVFLYFIL